MPYAPHVGQIDDRGIRPSHSHIEPDDSLTALSGKVSRFPTDHGPLWKAEKNYWKAGIVPGTVTDNGCG